MKQNLSLLPSDLDAWVDLGVDVDELLRIQPTRATPTSHAATTA